MFLRENGYDELFEKYCAVMALQVALPKTLAAYYSEFEPGFKSGLRIGLCGLTLWQAQCMESQIKLDDLRDAETNIRITCKFLRYLLKVLPEPNYWDVFRAFGESAQDLDITKIRQIYRYYSQKSGEPQSYEPKEMAAELSRRIMAGEKVI